MCQVASLGDEDNDVKSKNDDGALLGSVDVEFERNLSRHLAKLPYGRLCCSQYLEPDKPEEEKSSIMDCH